MSRPLWEIGEELRLVSLMFDENTLASEEDCTEALEKQLAALLAEEGAKVDGYIGLIRSIESEEAAAQAEIDRLQAARNARKAKREWLESNLKRYMEAAQVTLLTSAKGRKIKIVGNGGSEPVVIVDGVEPGKVPAQFVKVTTEFDKTRIREALQAGEQLVWASLGKRGTRLVLG